VWKRIVKSGEFWTQFCLVKQAEVITCWSCSIRKAGGW